MEVISEKRELETVLEMHIRVHTILTAVLAVVANQ